MSRWKAFGIHLLLSAGIVGAVFIFMLAMWYPWPLLEVAGGSHLIIILAIVDVVLGPFVTLLIFKTGKKSLKLDLATIGLLQCIAFTYGIHIVYIARPVYLVFTVDRFELVTAKDLAPQDLEKVKLTEFKRLPLGHPRYIAAVLPSDLREISKIQRTAFQGKDLQMYPQYYVPYERTVQDALRNAKPLNILLKRDAGRVQGYLNSTGRSPESVKFLPLHGEHNNATVLLDATSGRPLAIILVNPW